MTQYLKTIPFSDGTIKLLGKDFYTLTCSEYDYTLYALAEKLYLIAREAFQKKCGRNSFRDYNFKHEVLNNSENNSTLVLSIVLNFQDFEDECSEHLLLIFESNVVYLENIQNA